MAEEAPDKPPKKRIRRPRRAGPSKRLVTMADLDSRTKAAQVASSTKAAIVADLGGEEKLSTLELAMAENAALTAVVLRDLHVRWLKGQEVSISEMSTLTNTFNRTAAALAAERKPKDALTIEAYLTKDETK